MTIALETTSTSPKGSLFPSITAPDDMRPSAIVARDPLMIDCWFMVI